MADEKNATDTAVADNEVPEQAEQAASEVAQNSAIAEAAESDKATVKATPEPAPAKAATTTTVREVEQTKAERTAASETASRPAARQGRRARLILTRIDPWSVMKLAFLLSIAAALINVVATMLVWIVLKVLGVFSALDENIGSLLSSGTGTGAPDLGAYLSFSRWLGLATLTGVLNVFLITAICTLAAFLYNIATSLVGGIQVTLSD